jgi:hypothetical protein
MPFEARLAGEFGEGVPITWTFHLEDGPFDIENYYLNVAAHKEAFCAAGFSEIHRYAPRLSPEGEAGFGRDFWATFLDYSPIVFIECIKLKSLRRHFAFDSGCRMFPGT